MLAWLRAHPSTQTGTKLAKLAGSQSQADLSWLFIERNILRKQEINHEGIIKNRKKEEKRKYKKIWLFKWMCDTKANSHLRTFSLHHSNAKWKALRAENLLILLLKALFPRCSPGFPQNRRIYCTASAPFSPFPCQWAPEKKSSTSHPSTSHTNLPPFFPYMLHFMPCLTLLSTSSNI